MFLRLRITESRAGADNTVYLNKEPDGTLRFEEYKADTAKGSVSTRCVYGRTFTPEQATELKNYLTSQGY